MQNHLETKQQNKSISLSSANEQLSPMSTESAKLSNTGSLGIVQRQIQELVESSPQVEEARTNSKIANNSPQVLQAAQLQVVANSPTRSVVQKQATEEKEPLQAKKESSVAQFAVGSAGAEPPNNPSKGQGNNTGLPDSLKTGMESLSGMSLDDVKVHRNSDKPAQLQAHAYAQGTNIHLGPGQEQHLPHEAWHVVQQKQGRVKPTMQMKGKVSVNDDAGLEKEADVMGAKALSTTSSNMKPKVASKAKLAGLESTQLNKWGKKSGQEQEGESLLGRGEDESEGSSKRGAINPTVERHTVSLMELLRTQRKQVTALTALLKKGKKASAGKDVAAGITKIGMTVAMAAFGIPGLGEAGSETLTTGMESGIQGAEYAGQTAANKLTGIAADAGAQDSLSGESKDRRVADVNTRSGAAKSMVNPSLRRGARNIKKGREKMKEEGVGKTAKKAAVGGAKAGFAGVKMVLKPVIQVGQGVATLLQSDKSWKNEKRGHAEMAFKIVSAIRKQSDIAVDWVEQHPTMGSLEHKVPKAILGIFRTKILTLDAEIKKCRTSLEDSEATIRVYTTGEKAALLNGIEDD